MKFSRIVLWLIRFFAFLALGQRIYPTGYCPTEHEEKDRSMYVLPEWGHPTKTTEKSSFTELYFPHLYSSICDVLSHRWRYHFDHCNFRCRYLKNINSEQWKEMKMMMNWKLGVGGNSENNAWRYTHMYMWIHIRWTSEGIQTRTLLPTVSISWAALSVSNL